MIGIALVAACGGDDDTPSPAPATYSVGGSVSGLTGVLVLRLTLSGESIGNDLAVPANGNFTFAQLIPGGRGYTVTTQFEPSSQKCTISNGTGIIGNANVTNVSVTCSDAYFVGGTVSGHYIGLGLRLIVEGVDINCSTVFVTIGEDDPGPGFNTFDFNHALCRLLPGQTYSLTLHPPSGRTCSISNGTGVIGNFNVTNVAITCT
jgi:hypothetical protein